MVRNRGNENSCFNAGNALNEFCDSLRSGAIFRFHCGIVLFKKPVHGSDEANDLLLRSEEHTSELQSRLHLVCRLLLEKKKHKINGMNPKTAMTCTTYSDTRTLTAVSV